MSIIGGILSGALSNSMSTQSISRIEGTAYLPATLKAMSPSNAPYPLIGGIHTLVLQNNPETLVYPEFKADYKEMLALGLRNPTMHFVGNDRKPFPFRFVLEDYFDGPPHATKDSSGQIIHNGFENLLEVLWWLEELGLEVEEWGHPPFVRVSWGPWTTIGLLKSLKATSVAKYPNGDDKIIEVSIMIHPQPILVTNQQTHFKVT